MNNPNFKHRNAYAINREDNSAEFDLTIYLEMWSIRL